MINVLVTGAEGQLGMCLQKIAGNFPAINFCFKGSELLDITDKTQVEAVFAHQNFDFCINTAAYTNVEAAEKEPDKALLVNCKGVRIMAEAAKAYKVILIHLSTDYVFDGEKKEGYSSSDKPNPINEYGKSKLAGEQEIQELMDQFYIVRTSWLYSEFGHNFYKTILEKAAREERISVTDAEIGCPTNANNLALFLLELLESSKAYGIYHFTDGEAMSWYDFASRILKENGLEDQIALVKDNNYRTFARRPRNSVLK